MLLGGIRSPHNSEEPDGVVIRRRTEVLDAKPAGIA